MPPPYFYPEPPESIERRAIKRCGNVLGGVFCLSNIGITAVQILLMLVVALFYGNSVMATVFSDPIVLLLVQLIGSILMFTVPFLIGARVLKNRVSDLLPLRGVEPAALALCAGAGLMVCMIANLATTALSNVLTELGMPPSQADFPIPSGGAGKALYLLTISLAPALVEEFALRGVVLGSLRRYGDSFAILVSAALFGLMHGNLVQIPFAFVLGLLFGWLTVVTGSMWPAILIHFLNNFFAGVLELAGNTFPEYAGLLSGGYVLLLLLGGLCCLAALIRLRPALFRLPASRAVLPLGKQIGAFTGSAGIILTLILYGLSILSMQLTFTL